MISKAVLITFLIGCALTLCDGAGRRVRHKRSIPTPHEIQIQTIGNTIKLDWSFSDTRSDVTFLIKYRKKNDRDWITVRTPQRSLQLSHLQHSTSYEIQILAQTRAGQSLPSTIIQVPIPDPPRPIAPRRQESSSVPTPSSFEACLNGPDTVHLNWEPVMCGSAYCQYEVTVKQAGSGGSGQVFQYTTNSAVIGRMSAGQRFMFEIRAIHSDGRTMSYPRTAEARIPAAGTRIITADNIQVQSVQNQPKSVKVIWSILPSYMRNVAGYKVYYSKNKEAPKWDHVQVSGSTPEAILTNIEPGTAYFIRVVTEFRTGDTKTTSQTYRFVTPQAPLIQNIKLIYNSDQTMRLEWILHDHVNVVDLEGAQILWTNNRNLPENQWRILEARRGDNGITLPEKLEGNKQYFFKILPRVRGKSLVSSGTVFEIMTRPTTATSANLRLPDNVYDLRYIPRSRNVMLQWAIPNDRVRDLTGINIHWTYDQNVPQSRWNVVRVPKEARRAVIEGLDTTKTIFFSIEAVTRAGNRLPQRFYRISPRGTQTSSRRPQVPESINFETTFPRQTNGGARQTNGGASSQTQTAQTARPSNQHLARQLCLRGCTITMQNGRKSSTGCPHTEYCIEDCGTGRSGCGTGWCMSRTLMDAAKRHT